MAPSRGERKAASWRMASRAAASGVGLRGRARPLVPGSDKPLSCQPLLFVFGNAARNAVTQLRPSPSPRCSKASLCRALDRVSTVDRPQARPESSISSAAPSGRSSKSASAIPRCVLASLATERSCETSAAIVDGALPLLPARFFEPANQRFCIARKGRRRFKEIQHSLSHGGRPTGEGTGESVSTGSACWGREGSLATDCLRRVIDGWT